MNRKIQRKLNRTGIIPCDICEELNILVQHHIRGRNILQPNHPTNLCNICSNCHTKIHAGIIVIENKMLTSDGYKVIWHYYKEESITGDDAKPWLI